MSAAVIMFAHASSGHILVVHQCNRDDTRAVATAVLALAALTAADATGTVQIRTVMHTAMMQVQQLRTVALYRGLAQRCN
jgi:hypothetical protein